MAQQKRSGYVKNGIGYIPLSDGSLALVDPEDIPALTRWNWCPDTYGYVIRGHRPVRGGPVRFIKMHRLLLGITDPKVEVDHINRISRDNRRVNLRVATRRQNQANTTGRITGKLKGVHWRADRQKWWATCKRPGKPYHLGYFDSKADAIAARNAAVREAHGEFAFLTVAE